MADQQQAPQQAPQIRPAKETKKEHYLSTAIVVMAIVILVLLLAKGSSLNSNIQYALIGLGIAYLFFMMFMGKQAKPSIFDLARKCADVYQKSTSHFINYAYFESDVIADEDYLIQFIDPFAQTPYVTFRVINERILGFEYVSLIAKMEEINKQKLARQFVERGVSNKQTKEDLDRLGYYVQ
jgi:hypothetical protein